MSTDDRRHATVAALDSLWTQCDKDETALRRIQDMVQLLISAHSNTCVHTQAPDEQPPNNRGIGLTQEIQTFAQLFLSKFRYYYHNSMYYLYDGVNYTTTTEGDVAHTIAAAISKRGGALMDYKPRIKTAVMKQIKDRALFKSIPETETIQSVLRALVPAVAESKTAAKYFLTVLGDNIMQKRARAHRLTYYVSPAGRKMLDRLAVMAAPHMSIGCANFVTKYHTSHRFAQCRIVKLSPACNIGLTHVSIINLLCVAVHYAGRGSGDDYLHACGDQSLADTVLKLARHTPEQLVNQFVEQYIVQQTSPEAKLTTKQMAYIWRAFLAKSSLPNVIYVDGLMELLKARYTYDAISDAFIGITSGDLLQMDLFERFWLQHMRPYEMSDFENELEIDEICAAIQECYKGGDRHQFTEADTVRLIRHFFPTVDVLEEKYVLHWSCDLIDKAGDVRRTVESVRQNGISRDGLVPFDDIYVVYCSTTLHHQSVRLASKRYFYKYMQVFYAPYVVYDEFLSHDFFI